MDEAVTVFTIHSVCSRVAGVPRAHRGVRRGGAGVAPGQTGWSLLVCVARSRAAPPSPRPSRRPSDTARLRLGCARCRWAAARLGRRVATTLAVLLRSGRLRLWLCPSLPRPAALPLTAGEGGAPLQACTRGTAWAWSLEQKGPSAQGPLSLQHEDREDPVKGPEQDPQGPAPVLVRLQSG